MKITITKFYHDILLLLLILNSKVLLFGDWDRIFRYITAFVSIALFIVVLFDEKTMKRLRPYTRFVGRWFVLFFAFMLADICFCTSKYDVSVYYTFSQTYLFTYVLLVFPILAVITSGQYGLSKVIKELYFWGIASLVIRTFIWFLNNYLGFDLMHYLFFEVGYEWVRNGSQRVPFSCLTVFVLVYSVYNLSERKNKAQFICIILFLLFYAQFVVNARAAVLRLALTLAFAYWFSNRKAISVFIKSFLVILLVVLIILSGIATSFYYSIETWSIIARQQAYVYFFDLVKQFPLTGATLVEASTALERGPGGYFYYTDVGVVAKFAEFGVIGGILFFTPLIRMIFVALKTKTKRYSNKLFFLVMCVYTIGGCILTADVYFMRDIFSLPYIIAILEYGYYSGKLKTA